jgi:amino acid adenylation domain-containing protein
MGTASKLSGAMATSHGIQGGFLRSAEHYAHRPAVEVPGTILTYGELQRRAMSLAASLQHATPSGGPPLTAVFAYRSATAYAGVLASLLAGHGYVPLNRTFPAERTRTMLQRSGCRSLIVDASSEPQLEAVLDLSEESLLIILPERTDLSFLRSRWPQHTILGASDLEPARNFEEKPVQPDSIAYLLFTSGSTGIPKGVMVAHQNVAHFVSSMTDRYGISEHDRFSQTFDMTFDLSAFDMFVAWERGACICCPSEKTLLNPAKFIQEAKLTVWFSVPSVGVFMKRLGALKAGRFPTLRWSLFCGEPLPAEIVESWSRAAPNSVVENLYGPTELTIACCLYRWQGGKSEGQCLRGVVPIGYPFPGMDTLVVDEEWREVPIGADGELLMAGPQVALGYWRDPEKTASGFVVPPGKNQTYYRTGDRVRRPKETDPMCYLGRVDHQIKIQGHRVELGEVESLLREEARVEVAVAIGWPVTSSGAGGIEAFVMGNQLSPQTMLERLKRKLPVYAVPRRIHLLSELPLNPNGKIDRGKLTKLLADLPQF